MTVDQNKRRDNFYLQQTKAFMVLAVPEMYGSIQLDRAGRCLYNLYREALEQLEAEKGYQHLLFDPTKEWKENLKTLLAEMQKGHYPNRDKLQTYVDRLLLAEVWQEHLDYLQQASIRQTQRAMTALFNLHEYRFFWQRLEAYWMYLYPEERLQVLDALTENKWQKEIPHKVTSVLEGAQLLQKFDFAIGNQAVTHSITREECEYILDFSLSVEDLTQTLFKMYGCQSKQKGVK